MIFTRSLSIFFSLSLGVFITFTKATTFDVVNQCLYTVWVGATPLDGWQLNTSGGWQLKTGESRSFTVNPGTEISQIWGRTNCRVDDDGRTNCQTGDCSGLLQCQNLGSPPLTLAEISLNRSLNLDFMDISLVNGFNIPMELGPATNVCRTIQCSADINGQCPEDLQTSGGCYSACNVFKTNEFCCERESCGPTEYSRFFKKKCPNALTYKDDAKRNFTCPAGTNYTVVFCPSKMGTVVHDHGAQFIGACYGQNGNNLPTVEEVVNLYYTSGVGSMRIYDPNIAILQALKGSNIQLILGVPNDNLQALASNASSATQWVQKYVKFYSPDVKFRYIAVGNEVSPSDANAQYVLPAMENIYTAITSAGLQHQIKVSTSISTGLLGVSYPPSSGAFSDDANSFISPIISFLATNGAPLLANVYPYFSYINNPQSIQLRYALFTSPAVVVQDGNLGYQNLFDALLDALYSALERAEGSNVAIVVSESGWPSKGGDAATVDNAQTYYKNLINHVKGGTPKMSGQAIETYLFAMFDENMNIAGMQHFGLFTANQQPKYQISFA